MDYNLINEINNKSQQLDMQIKSLAKNGSEYAKAYTSYRVALAKELVKLKDEGYAISLASDIARGKSEVAKLKFQEITKEALYKANLEAIQATKLQIKIIQNQIEKEYYNEK